MIRHRLLVFSAVFGFGGAFISLLISKWMAKRAMGVQVITQPANETERWLVNVVRQQAQTAGIGMPEVGIFDSPDPNAFATGANKNSALVAVSTGLLRNMRRDEVEAVLGHEVEPRRQRRHGHAHAHPGRHEHLRVLPRARHRRHRRQGHPQERSRGTGIGYFVTVIVAQIVLGFLAGMVVAWFSRQREFRADAGGAHLAGTQLDDRRARSAQARRIPLRRCPSSMKAFGINERHPAGPAEAVMSHPPLDERIAALNSAR